MKMMKRALALATACTMLLLLCACGRNSKRLAAQQDSLCSGKWLTSIQDSREQALSLAKKIDLYEEELALVDLDSLKHSRIIEYSMDGTYRQYISVEHTRRNVRDFYEGIFHALFEGRAALGGLYGEDLTPMDPEEFQIFYAGLYGHEDFADLLDQFAEEAYDYRWEDLETGTYRVDREDTLFISRITPESEADSDGLIPFRMDSETLTLEYSDGSTVYTHIG